VGACPHTTNADAASTGRPPFVAMVAVAVVVAAAAVLGDYRHSVGLLSAAAAFAYGSSH
jgi:hypothetical protein